MTARRVDADRQQGGCRHPAGLRGHELQRLRRLPGTRGARCDGRGPAPPRGRPKGPLRGPRRAPCRRPSASLSPRRARPRFGARRRGPRHGRPARPLREGRGRSRSGHPALPVRALPVDRQLAPGRPAREPAGHLERIDAAAVELQLDAQHQHRDELLAGRGRQPGGVPRAAPGLRRGALGERTAHGRGQLRRPRLGGAPQRRPLGPDRAGRELRRGRSQVGELVDERRVAQHPPVGALRVRRATPGSCASAPGRS